MNKLHFEEDAAEFDAAIHYLDDLSILLHYPNILPRVVFADPQVLLDKVTELVLTSFKMSIISKCKALSNDWCMFFEYALVTVKFLSQDEFSKHYVPGLFEVEDLIQLFKKLLIFATFKDTQLFVPALLRSCSHFTSTLNSNEHGAAASYNLLSIDCLSILWCLIHFLLAICTIPILILIDTNHIMVSGSLAA